MTELDTLRARVAYLEAELKRHQTRMAGMITIEAVSETRWRNRELEAMVEDLREQLAQREISLPS